MSGDKGKNDLEIGETVLLRELEKPEGMISLTWLGKILTAEGLDDERILRVFSGLKMRAGSIDQIDMGAPWFYSPRSFYTKIEAQKIRKNLEQQADQKASEINTLPSAVQALNQVPAKTNRQDEAKLCAYVKDALEVLYDRDTQIPDHVEEFVFDVHSQRPDGIFRNVDIIAVDWADAQSVELIAVEVKLDFNPESVQQASFYQRFANRSWVAVLVADGRADQAWQAVQNRDQSLFEHAVGLGLGILACFTSQGGGYRVVPVQWPKKNQPDQTEQRRFMKAYKSSLEMARVVPENDDRKYPKVV